MALVDRTPPSRLSVVERGGRLVVVDRETGHTPPTAAERMAAHDRARGIEPIQPPQRSIAPDVSDAARAESGLSARPAPVSGPPPSKARQPETRTNDRSGARGSKQPWARQPDRAALTGARKQTPSASQPPSPAGDQRQTIVTSKWWDAKGPRTITLSPQGQAVLRSGFVILAAIILTLAMVLLVVKPILLFIVGLLLFRLHDWFLGPLGATLVNKAMGPSGADRPATWAYAVTSAG